MSIGFTDGGETNGKPNVTQTQNPSSTITPGQYNSTYIVFHATLSHQVIFVQESLN